MNEITCEILEGQLLRAVDKIRSSRFAPEASLLVADILAGCASRYSNEVETYIRTGHGPAERHRVCGNDVPHCDCIRAELRLAEFYL